MSEKFVIVGAGVIGLTVAYRLLEKYPNGHITIVASEFPTTEQDKLSTLYTSTRAGAHYRPFPSSTEHDPREAGYTRVTQRVFKQLSVEQPNSSIKFVDGIEYFQDPSPLYLNLLEGYTEEIEQFQVLPHDELPNGIKFGTKYRTWVLNPPHYLNFLMGKLKDSGIVHFRADVLKCLKQVDGDNGTTIVNCSGQGLQYEGNFDYDPASYKIRGQTLLLKNSSANNTYNDKTITYQLHGNVWSFVIPRPLGGGIILGGTKNIRESSVEPVARETTQLLSNAAKHFPDLDIKPTDIIRVNVGFRPARRGGSLVARDCTHRNIIHAYGFGGMGFEVSFGVADHVLQLIKRQYSKL